MHKELIDSLRSLIKRNGFVIVPISSDSMNPVIKKEDRIRINILIKSPEIGDIIAYQKFDNHITVHRIHNIVRSGQRYLYITKGDNNIKNDPYFVTKDEILGVVDIIQDRVIK